MVEKFLYLIWEIQLISKILLMSLIRLSGLEPEKDISIEYIG